MWFCNSALKLDERTTKMVAAHLTGDPQHIFALWSVFGSLQSALMELMNHVVIDDSITTRPDMLALFRTLNPKKLKVYCHSVHDIYSRWTKIISGANLDEISLDFEGTTSEPGVKEILDDIGNFAVQRVAVRADKITADASMINSTKPKTLYMFSNVLSEKFEFKIPTLTSLILKKIDVELAKLDFAALKVLSMEECVGLDKISCKNIEVCFFKNMEVSKSTCKHFFNMSSMQIFQWTDMTLPENILQKGKRLKAKKSAVLVWKNVISFGVLQCESKSGRYAGPCENTVLDEKWGQ